MRRRSAISMSATASRSTAIRLASSSTPRAQRFLDEGADFHSYTYAKYGGEILKQPGMFAWQVFDQKTVPPAARRIPHPAHHEGKGRHARRAGRQDRRRRPPGFLETMRAFNAAPRPDVPFNPNIHDGLRTNGLAIDKTNWAQPLDTPPYEAYGVTTGITFTFGGLKITNDARGRGRHRRADPRPVRGGRDRRRALLPQLRQRHRADGRRRVRPHRRHAARRPMSGTIDANGSLTGAGLVSRLGGLRDDVTKPRLSCQESNSGAPADNDACSYGRKQALRGRTNRSLATSQRPVAYD